MSPNRRSVLAIGGSALPLGLAGCLGNNPGGDDSPEEIELAAQLPAPDLLGMDRYQFEYFDIEAISEDRPDLVDPLAGTYNLQDLYGLLYLAGLTVEDLDFLTDGHDFAVAHGDFDVDALASDLDANGFTQAADDDEATIYRIEGVQGNPAAIGLSDTQVVTAGFSGVQDGEDLHVGDLARDPVEIVSDIGALDAESDDRYTAAVPAIDSLVAQIEGGAIGRGEERRYHHTQVDDGTFEQQVANGVAWRFDDDGIDFTEALVFDPEVSPPEDDIDAWLDNEMHFHTWGATLQQTSGYDVTIDENVAIVEGRYTPHETGWLD